jgi:hypothetical protein
MLGSMGDEGTDAPGEAEDDAEDAGALVADADPSDLDAGEPPPEGPPRISAGAPPPLPRRTQRSPVATIALGVIVVALMIGLGVAVGSLVVGEPPAAPPVAAAPPATPEPPAAPPEPAPVPEPAQAEADPGSDVVVIEPVIFGAPAAPDP